MGCFGVRSRRRRDAKRSTRRPRREPCALPFCLTHSSSSQSTLHRPHGPLSYADSRLEQPWSAVTAPICPRRSSPGICLSLCVPSPCLSSNTRSLEKKLGLADRKCFVRPPPPAFLWYLRQAEGSGERVVNERSKRRRGREQSDLRGLPGELQPAMVQEKVLLLSVLS